MLEAAVIALRLVLVAAFVALAVEDIRTRTCPRWVWYPIVAVGVMALALEALAAVGTPQFSFVAVRVGVGLAFLIPAAAFIWVSGGGKADAKALLALGIAFPTGLGAPLAAWGPAVPFSISVFVNAMVIAVPVTLALAGAGRLDRGVPFLAYVAAGLVLAVTVGDLALLGVSLLG